VFRITLGHGGAERAATVGGSVIVLQARALDLPVPSDPEECRRGRLPKPGQRPLLSTEDKKRPSLDRGGPSVLRAACGNRTHDLRITSASLWPTELRRPSQRLCKSSAFLGRTEIESGRVSTPPVRAGRWCRGSGPGRWRTRSP